MSKVTEFEVQVLTKDGIVNVPVRAKELGDGDFGVIETPQDLAVKIRTIKDGLIEEA